MAREDSKASEKKSNDSMSLAEIVADMNKKNPFLKTPIKRRREEKKDVEEAALKRFEYLSEKAKTAIIPSEASAILKPEHFFKDNGPLIIHLCSDCRKYNSTRPTTNLGDGKVEMPMAMCTICRSHFNRQRVVKFYDHEVPVFKKQHGL